MLAEWWKGKSADAPTELSPTEAASSAMQKKREEHLRRLREDEVPLAQEASEEEKVAARDRAVRKKLRDSAKEAARGPGPNNTVTYDTMFRGLQRVVMAAEGDNSEGVSVGIARQVHNLQVQSKWSVGNPQSAGWDLNLQMNGFSGVTAVTYSTMGRLMLLHQRSFKSGGLGVLQFMAQPDAMAQGQPPTLFAMLQYPWLGGATQLNYLRPQHVVLSHAARLIRGVTVGASMTYDLNTQGTAMQYGFSTTSADKSTNWYGQYTPEAGTWKLAVSKQDWANDGEMAVQLEMAEKKGAGGGNPMAMMMGGGGGGPPELGSALTIALRKNFIGGAVVGASLTSFTKLKAELELPFGGTRPGMNQAALQYSINYDAATGAAKHGLSLTL